MVDYKTEQNFELGGKGTCKVCFILIESVVKMCPSCSAIFCQKCIDRLLKFSCPCCRAQLDRNSYVRNRLAEELNEESRARKKEQCNKHEQLKSYYCIKSTCMMALCPECFIEDHNGHDRKKVKELY